MKIKLYFFILIILKLNFHVVKSNEFKDQKLTIVFQQGQDFEFVKYSISKRLDCFQDKIVKIIFFNLESLFEWEKNYFFVFNFGC